MDDRIANENGDTQCVQIDMPQSLMSRVRSHCDKHKITVQEFIRDALSENCKWSTGSAGENSVSRSGSVLDRPPKIASAHWTALPPVTPPNIP